MNIERYVVFLRLAEAGSITAAAQQLGYTQSGISHVVNGLEEEFGFRLLIRQKTGVELTEEAKMLLEPMQEVVNHNESLLQLAGSISGVTFGIVRVGAFSSVTVHWIPDIISVFQKQFPMVKVQLMNDTYSSIEKAILAGQIDCGFISQAAQNNLHFIPLYTDPLIAVIPKSHPLSRRKHVPLASLLDEPFILPCIGANYDIDNLLRSGSAVHNIRFAPNDDFAAISMVEHGLGISIMPELMLQEQHNKVCCVKIDPTQLRTIGIATRTEKHISPACRAFLQCVQEWVLDHYEQSDETGRLLSYGQPLETPRSKQS